MKRNSLNIALQIDTKESQKIITATKWKDQGKKGEI